MICEGFTIRQNSPPSRQPLGWPRAQKRVKLPCNSTMYRPEGHLDSRDSLQDAGDQAKEEKSGEGLRGGSQAGEEAEEAKREDRRSGRPEIPLAVFQREPGRAPVRPNAVIRRACVFP